MHTAKCWPSHSDAEWAHSLLELAGSSGSPESVGELAVATVGLDILVGAFLPRNLF